MCVNDEDALVIVIVEALPISTEVADTEEALGIESRVMVADAVMDS